MSFLAYALGLALYTPSLFAKPPVDPNVTCFKSVGALTRHLLLLADMPETSFFTTESANIVASQELPSSTLTVKIIERKIGGKQFRYNFMDTLAFIPHITDVSGESYSAVIVKPTARPQVIFFNPQRGLSPAVGIKSIEDWKSLSLITTTDAGLMVTGAEIHDLSATITLFDHEGSSLSESEVPLPSTNPHVQISVDDRGDFTKIFAEAGKNSISIRPDPGLASYMRFSQLQLSDRKVTLDSLKIVEAVKLVTMNRNKDSAVFPVSPHNQNPLVFFMASKYYPDTPGTLYTVHLRLSGNNLVVRSELEGALMEARLYEDGSHQPVLIGTTPKADEVVVYRPLLRDSALLRVEGFSPIEGRELDRDDLLLVRGEHSVALVNTHTGHIDSSEIELGDNPLPRDLKSFSNVESAMGYRFVARFRKERTEIPGFKVVPAAVELYDFDTGSVLGTYLVLMGSAWSPLDIRCKLNVIGKDVYVRATYFDSSSHEYFSHYSVFEFL